jgi:hypothetical protein
MAQIIGEEQQMTTIILGNGNNLSVSDDNSNGAAVPWMSARDHQQS